MTELIKTISPIDGKILLERSLASAKEISIVLEKSAYAQQQWQLTSIEERKQFCHCAIDELLKMQSEIALEITQQMGRPIRYTPGEIKGLEERGRVMIELAETELADISIEQSEQSYRSIKRQPVGVVLVIAPWNYPYLTAVNTIIPAIMAGNTVILKHSAQTPLCAERFVQAFKQAGVPEGVIQYLHLSHQSTAELIHCDEIAFVAFTGSVAGGREIEKASVGRFIGVGLELGGKDPAFVRADADILNAVENLVDGAFFNSGQSCCGIERIYVHQNVYDDFLESFVDLTKQYQLGNPLEEETTLGPLVNAKSAEFVRQQINQAVKLGATACINPQIFSADKLGSPYMAPQVLTNVNHQMSVMTEESFGPVVGIMKVSDDQQAIHLMNNSQYGLTASLWTQDIEQAKMMGCQIQTGTVFMNRCDYLDPALPWTGVKNTGRGMTLSALGYQQLTQAKSYNFRR
ncbi:MAG: aldehyde dehydrogenase family protein [Methylococcales bacterium]|jgi:acyl-CoA reductase-like NAD-dependent aldehyde dehydrogenase|nr:aldehyde dehydrogenase family protein [Methylococcales bacterium]MBT7409526.1 aldehyde dehydrogenase family protein [Methylococcales bacterium]